MLSGPSHPSGHNTAMRRRACEAIGRASGRIAALLLVALAAATLGTGCGSDDDPDVEVNPPSVPFELMGALSTVAMG